MQNKQLESQIEFLLSAALKKCGNMLYDGDYDNDEEKVNQHPCPMILVIE